MESQPIYQEIVEGALYKHKGENEGLSFQQLFIDMLKNLYAGDPDGFSHYFIKRITMTGLAGLRPDLCEHTAFLLPNAHWACVAALAMNEQGFLLNEVEKIVDEFESFGSQSWARQSQDFGELFRLQAILNSLILGDFSRAEGLFKKWPKFRHQKIHSNALQKLTQAGKEGVAKSTAFEEFQTYFDDIRSPLYKNHKDESWDKLTYPHACGLLIDRIKANWQGEPNWKNITEMVSH